jgi:carotenoid cleavage dioxygenase
LPLDVRSLREDRPLQQTYLDDLTGEFPRIDDRRAGLPKAIGWYACANPELPMFGALSGIVHVDGNGKRLGIICCRPATPSPSRCSSSARGCAERRRWLLAVVWRARENRSDLAVFNATMSNRPCGAGCISAIACRTGSPWQLGRARS